MKNLEARLGRVEYHQKLLLQMINPAGHEFDCLIIMKDLSEFEVQEFYALCGELHKEMKKQKAEKFVFFAPLFDEFCRRLSQKLQPAEVIQACLKQNVYPELMQVLEKNLS
ncbi:MAG TPA: DUF1878 family protein [Bacillaceae bacterium]